jgi:hypothetical protein
MSVPGTKRTRERRSQSPILRVERTRSGHREIDAFGRVEMWRGGFR